MLKRYFAFLLCLVITLTSIVPIGAVAQATDTAHTQTTGTTYYVDGKSGDDNNNGKDISSAFKTIQKASEKLIAGDTCIIRQGTYNETITPVNSGTADKRITYKAYEGETVTISACDPVTGWSKYSGNIYRAPISWDMTDDKMAFVDGKLMTLARYPNNTDNNLFKLKFASMQNGSNTSITDSGLAGYPENAWKGATVTTKGEWTTQSVKCTGSNGSTLIIEEIFDRDQRNLLVPGTNYYVEDTLTALDTEKEWYVDNNSNFMYIWMPGGVNPSNSTVEAKKRKNCIDLNGKSYINIEGINTIGGGTTTGGGSYNLLKRINAKYISYNLVLPRPYEIDGVGLSIDGNNNTLRDSNVQYSSGNGICVTGKDNKIINNAVYDTDFKGYYDAAIAVKGDRHLVSYNTLSSSGRDLMNLQDIDACIIEYNDMSHSGKVSKDNGALYVVVEEGGNTEIRYNKVHDHREIKDTKGIYIDNACSNFIIHHNTVWNTQSETYMLNIAANFELIYDNISDGKMGSWYHQAFEGDTYGSRFENNISATYDIRGEAVQSGNVTQGFNKDTYPAVGQNLVNPPEPVYSLSTPQFRNLLRNTSFDRDLSLWATKGNVTKFTATATDTDYYPLKGEHRATRTTYGSMQLGAGKCSGEQVVTGLQPNTTYEFSGWLNLASGEKASIGVKDYGGNNLTQSRDEKTVGSWVRRTYRFSTGPSSTSATIFVNKDSEGSKNVYADDFGLIYVSDVSEVSEVKVKEQNTRITLSWINPTNEDVQSVKIYCDNVEVANIEKGKTTYTVDKLTDDKEYTFSLKAVDKSGKESEGVVVKGTPKMAEVLSVGVKEETTKLTLSWTSPEDSDFSKVYIYDSSNKLVKEVLKGKNSHTIIGLENGKEYSYKIVAVDSAGNQSTGVAAKGTPIMPEVLSAGVKEETTKLKLNWTAPKDDDFNKVNIYDSHDALVSEVAKGMTTYTVTGLTNGKEYTYKIKAVDGKGNESTGVLVSGTPKMAEISSMKVIPENEKLKLTWTDPGDSDFKNVKIYKGDSIVAIVEKGKQTYTSSSLTNGKLYKYTVIAVDAKENESAGILVSGIPQVQDVIGPTITVGSTALVFKWTDPQDSTFQGVKIYSGNSVIATINKGVRTHSITGLQNGIQYNYTIKAVYSTGEISTGVYLSGTPKIADITLSYKKFETGNGYVKLEWYEYGASEDTTFGGVNIYGPDQKLVANVDKGVKCYVIKGLTNGVEYKFTLKARDTMGNESTAVPVSVMSSITEVNNLKVVAGDGELVLSCSDPEFLGFKQLKIYTEDGTTVATIEKTKTKTLNYTIKGLTNGKEYKFKIVACDNEGGESQGIQISCVPKPMDISVVDLSGYFNRDGFSSHEKPDDGNLFTENGKIYSYAAEKVNVAPIYNGIKYQLGSMADGQKNVVDCVGQTIDLKQGEYNSINFVTAANRQNYATIKVNYSDGTSENKSIQILVWDDDYTKQSVQKFDHRHSKDGDYEKEVYFYVSKLDIKLGKVLTSISLPNNDNLRIMAMNLVKQVSSPVITTKVVTDIVGESANISGEIKSNGGSDITECGFIYSTNSNPKAENGTVVKATSVNSGVYSANITGLAAGAKYYYRAYAINSTGTVYGNVESFSTTVELKATLSDPQSIWYGSNNPVLRSESIFETSLGAIINCDGVYAADITLTYDPDVFEYQEYSLIAGNKLKVYVKSDELGKIRVIAASMGQQLKSDEISQVLNMVKLKFKAKGVNKPSDSKLVVSNAIFGLAPSGNKVAGLNNYGPNIQVRPYVPCGDIDESGKIDINDLASVAASYGMSHEDNGWSTGAESKLPAMMCDVTGMNGYADGKVDISDLAYVAKRLK